MPDIPDGAETEGGGHPAGQPIQPGTGALIAAGRTSAPAAPIPDYAGFWNRAAAWLIDAIITLVVSLLVAAPVFAFLLLSIIGQGGDDADALFPALQLINNLVSGIAGWLYFALMESSRYQGTVGKLAVQIKVTDLHGNPLTFGRASGRYFGKLLSGLLLGIGYFMAAFTEKKQGLHDIMAGCLVVRK